MKGDGNLETESGSAGTAKDPKPDDPAIPGSYRYDAFISYRHADPDRRWAQWLHSALETYRVPPRLVREKGLRPRISRVFRDEEELPASADLSREIDNALEQSEFLIVICSPRTPPSEWVDAEVRRFRDLGRHDRILALLIEGEPAQSFPRALCEIRRKVVDASGSFVEEIESVEPLAADVRSSRPEGPRHLKRMAKLRLLACILGCRFDDLRQRDLERQNRRRAIAVAAMGLLLLAMAGLSAWALHEADQARKAEGVATVERDNATAAREIANEQRREAQRQRDAALRAQREAEVEAAWAKFGEANAALARGDTALVLQSARALEGGFRRLGLPAIALTALERGAYGAGGFCALECKGHTREVRSVRFSPDGKRCVSGSSDKTLILWDVASGTKLVEFTGHRAGVTSAAFSPDGKTVLSGSHDATVRLWAAETGMEIRRYLGHTDLVLCVCFSPDGTRVLAGGKDGNVRLWDAVTANHLRAVKAGDGWILSARFSPDGDRFVAACQDGLARVFDARSGGELAVLKGHKGVITSAAFTPDGTRIVSGGEDKTLRVWDARTGRNLGAFPEIGTCVYDLDVTADGKYVLCACHDGEVKTWDLEGGKVHRRHRGHPSPVFSADLSPDGAGFVSAGGDYTIRLWKHDAEEAVRVLQGPLFVRCLAFSPDGLLFASGDEFCRVMLWDALDGRLAGEFQGHAGPVNGVAFSPDGGTILSGSDDGTLRLWEVATGAGIREFKGHGGPVNAVAFTGDGLYCLSASADGTARLWAVPSGTLVKTFSGCEGPVLAVAVSPDNRLVAAGSRDQAVRIWDAGSSELLHTLRGSGGAVGAVAFYPDGAFCLSGHANGLVRLWNVKEGKLVRELPGQGGSVQSLAFAPDGGTFLLASSNGTLGLWNMRTGSMQQDFQADELPLRTGVFTPDGRACASGGDSAAVRVWEIDDDKACKVLKGHTGLVNGVLFAPDGLTLVSGDADGVLIEWDAATGLALRTMEGWRFDPPDDFAISPDGVQVLTTGAKGPQLWDLQTGLPIREFSSAEPGFRVVAFSPDGKTVAGGDRTGSFHLWDASSGQRLLMVKGHQSPVSSLAFSPDGRRLLSVGDGEAVRLWDRATGECTRTHEARPSAPRTAIFSADGSAVLSHDADEALRLRDLDGSLRLELPCEDRYTSWAGFSPDGRLLLSLDVTRLLRGRLRAREAGSGRPVLESEAPVILYSAAVLPGGGRLLAAGDDGLYLWDYLAGGVPAAVGARRVHTTWIALSSDGRTAVSSHPADSVLTIWSVEGWERAFEIRGDSGRVSALACPPDGSLLVSAHGERFRTWDLRTGSMLLNLRDFGESVNAVAFAPDGRRFAMGGKRGAVELWDSRTGKRVLTTAGHREEVHAVAFASDGSWFLSGSHDGCARAWDARSGAARGELRGHLGSVQSVAVSPDGSTALTGSADRMVRLWDLRTSRVIRELLGHSDGILGVAYSPDGRIAATSSQDGTMKLWALESGALLADLSGHADTVTGAAFSPDGRVLASSGNRDRTVRVWDLAYYEKARQALSRVDALRRRAAGRPRDGESWKGFGDAMFLRNQWRMARLCYEKAALAGAEGDDLRRAQAFWLDGDPGKAAESLRKVRAAVEAGTRSESLPWIDACLARAESERTRIAQESRKEDIEKAGHRKGRYDFYAAKAAEEEAKGAGADLSMAIALWRKAREFADDAADQARADARIQALSD